MVQKSKNPGSIVIYKTSEGPEIKISFKDETLWLTQSQTALLFGTQRPAITKHLNNIYKTAELSQKAVCSILEHTANDGKVYKTQFYSLDAVIAVGYRVNTKQATQFRIWATNQLKTLLVNGYVINESRLKENTELKLKELEGTVKFLKQVVESRRLEGYEVELLNIITDYTQTWVTLNRYDLGTLKIERITKKSLARLKYEEVQKTIIHFKTRLQKNKEASHLFGKEVGNKLKSALGAVHQTFDGIDVYPSVEEKAAHLLYFIIKDHPFVDGNKRIGALLFLVYLIENRALYNKKGERKIESPALTTLALLVAESHPTQKEIMIKLIVNLINN